MVILSGTKRDHYCPLKILKRVWTAGWIQREESYRPWGTRLRTKIRSFPDSEN